jgi:surface antigen
LSHYHKIKLLKLKMPTLRTFTAYAAVFTVLISAIGFGYQSDPTTVNTTSPVLAKNNDQRAGSSVDEVTALQVAGRIAERAELPVATNIANLSISVDAKNRITQGDAAVISKPQIIEPTAYSRLVVDYVAKDGETLQSIANQFSVTTQTIKWANSLSVDTITPGSSISIPPIDGVVYSVHDGDTVETIAIKYKSDVAQIISFNDLELSGIKNGQQIILPNGELPVQERPGYSMPLQSANRAQNSYSSTGGATSLINGFSPISMTAAGNAYAFGNCTSWAYERRVQLGHPVGSYWGNAATWDSLGRAAGYVVDKSPTAGSVFQMPAFVDAYTGAYGHVGIVESVNPDGSVYVSEMNYAGNFNRVTYRTIPAGQAALYNYIH